MLEEYGIVTNNADLEKYNTYHLKSKCKSLITVNDNNKLKSLIKYLNDINEKYFIIGNGSNIILPEYYDGVVIKLNINELTIKDNIIEVEASYMINKLALVTINNNLKGLEWASGIPGTIGGSIVNNATCFKGELMPLIIKIDVLDNNEFKTITIKDFDYSYHYTSLKAKKMIVLKAYLKLEYGNKVELLQIIKDRTLKRRETQPLEYPSAGSVFRNPENANPAGKLIDDAGLKGLSIGGAEVSLKHGNFIINKNNATSEDIKKLILKIHEEVLTKYKIDLILEQEIIN